MRRILKWLTGFVVVVVVSAAGLGGYVVYDATRPYRGYEGEVVVDVPPGSGSREIVDLLVENRILGSRLTSLSYLYASSYRGRLQAGEYLFSEALSTERVFAKLAAGDVRMYSFSVPEGLRLDQIAERWEMQGFGSGNEFREAASASLSRVRTIDPDAVSVEGYLFPETYSFPKTVTAAVAVRAMISQFEVAIEALRSAVDPADWPLDLNGTVIMASLIESEAAVADERTLISSVFHNRLGLGMRLECDPTVIYALLLNRTYGGRLLRADLSFDSPYNTYRYAGLPPGPISNPGYASLLAAVRPDMTEFIFFVRTEGGRHTFSRTLAEHNRAVAAYRQLQ